MTSPGDAPPAECRPVGLLYFAYSRYWPGIDKIWKLARVRLPAGACGQAATSRAILLWMNYAASRLNGTQVRK
jgi:hypothetical protein